MPHRNGTVASATLRVVAAITLIGAAAEADTGITPAISGEDAAAVLAGKMVTGTVTETGVMTASLQHVPLWPEHVNTRTVHPDYEHASRSSPVTYQHYLPNLIITAMNRQRSTVPVEHGIPATDNQPVIDVLADFGAVMMRPGDEEMECLAQALYFEARGESVAGQRAVAEVIMNRVKSHRFPDTICGVVRQGGYKKNWCQFSYYCDGETETIREMKVYKQILKLVSSIMLGDLANITSGATHYHNVYVNPHWADRLERTTKIGRHIFYRS